jgi:hypothetical protein
MLTIRAPSPASPACPVNDRLNKNGALTLMAMCLSHSSLEVESKVSDSNIAALLTSPCRGWIR